MTHAERVPVKMGNVQIGIARVDDDGTIEITLNQPIVPGNVLLEYIRRGVVKGLSIMPIVDPETDADPGQGQQRVSEYQGFHHPKNDGHNYKS